MSLSGNFNSPSNRQNYQEAADWLVNDPDFVEAVGADAGAGKLKYLSKFTSLISFLNEHGAENLELVVDEGINIAGNLALPSNIRINPQAGAIFNVPADTSLQINSIAPIGRRRIFTGDGYKIFGKNAVEEISLAYWLGNDTSLNAWAAIEDMMLSAVYSNGGRLHFPNGKWQTYGQHSYGNAPCTIIGDGCSPDQVALATSIELVDHPTAGNNVPRFIFKIGGLLRNLEISNLALRSSYSGQSTGVLVSGGFQQTTIGIFLDKVVMAGFGVGLDILSTDATAWQCEQVLFERCQWIGNLIGVRCNTNNNSMNFVSPFVQLPDTPGAICFQFNQCGEVVITNYNFTGSHSYLAPETPGVINPRLGTGIEINGDHLPIKLIGGQDEGIGRLIKKTVPLYQPITVENCLVQSSIDLLASSTIILRECKAPSKVFRDPGTVGFISYAIADNCKIFPFDVFLNPSPPTFDGFTNGGVLLSESIVDDHAFKRSHELTRQSFPKSFDTYNIYPNEPLHQYAGKVNRKLLQFARLDANGTVVQRNGSPVIYTLAFNEASELVLTNGSDVSVVLHSADSVIGDLNRATNTLEKINRRVIEMPALPTAIGDEFNGEIFDSIVFWKKQHAGENYLTQSGGKMKHNSTGDTGIIVFATRAAYDFNDKSVEWHLADVGQADEQTSEFCAFGIRPDDNTNSETSGSYFTGFEFSWSNPLTISVRYAYLSGNGGEYIQSITIPERATRFRFRSAGGVIYYDVYYAAAWQQIASYDYAGAMNSAQHIFVDTYVSPNKKGLSLERITTTLFPVDTLAAGSSLGNWDGTRFAPRSPQQQAAIVAPFMINALDLPALKAALNALP